MTFQNSINPNNADFQQTTGVFELANRDRLKGGYSENLGIAYNGGTGVFTIQAADGNALSTSNPGYVILHSKATPGKMIKYKITTNYTFIDDVGASQIIGNLFGLTTSVATDNDVPFFIYFVSNDSETAVTPMLCRVAGTLYAPSNTVIGKPSSAIADTNYSMWALDDTITVTDYDSNPALNIGMFRMRMSGADDWTVQALSYSPGDNDGIGVNISERNYYMPSGQFGAVASRFMRLNGGTTVPQWTNQYVRYIFLKDNIVQINYEFSGDGGVDGNGAVNVQIILPFIGKDIGATQGTFVGTWISFGAGLTGRIGTHQISDGSNTVQLLDYLNAYVTYNAYTSGNRVLRGQFIYRIGGT